LLSSEHFSRQIGTPEEKFKPHIILHYNGTKGGVDNADQMIKEFSARRITMRWPMALFGNFIDIAALNAYVLRKYSSTQNRESFLKTLATDLIVPSAKRRIAKGRYFSASLRRNLEIVTGEIVPASEPQPSENPKTSQSSKGRCHMCPPGKKKCSSNRCNKCNNFICQDHTRKIHVCNKCDQ